MQCLISQKQRINEVKMFCQIIFPRELVKEMSHPIKLFLCQLLLHKYEVLLQSADVLKMATNSKIIKYPIPHSQLKNPHKPSSVSLHIVHHYDRDEPFVQRHCASVRLIVGVSSTLKVFLGMVAHASRLIDIPITPHSFPKEMFYLITELGSFQGPNRTAF